MGLFNNESKEEKQARKMQETLAKYELNNLSTDYAKAVKNISSVFFLIFFIEL